MLSLVPRRLEALESRSESVLPSELNLLLDRTSFCSWTNVSCWSASALMAISLNADDASVLLPQPLPVSTVKLLMKLSASSKRLLPVA